MVSDAVGKGDIPMKHAEVVSGSEALMWKASMEFEIDSLWQRGSFWSFHWGAKLLR